MGKKRSQRGGSRAGRNGNASADLSGERTLARKSQGGWTLSEGDTLGGYRVVRPLGRGGMGEVYLAENIQTGFKYALKLLPSDLASDSGFRERFGREAAVLQALRHDGIVMVHHAAEEAGRFFLTMDYVEGGSLDGRLKEKGKLTEDEVARVALELADALGYAHGKGVIHRDIKPSNVLLDKDGRAKLSDFGLARVVGGDFLKSMTERSISLSMARTGGGAGLSQSDNAVIGTYEYMSPEQKAGTPADERSDIFSLGLMIYRMLTGEKAEGRFPDPSKVGCSRAWDAVIDRTLAPKPDGRYADVAALADDLKGAAEEDVANGGMTAHIYCGTAAQVAKTETGTLLDGQYNAIWCPPPGVIQWHSDPKPGDLVYLVWRNERRGDPLYLLGCGRIRKAGQARFGGDVLWTNADCPGVIDEARRLGYRGPNNMAFLRLCEVRRPVGEYPCVSGIDPVHNGLTEATGKEAQVLEGLMGDPGTLPMEEDGEAHSRRVTTASASSLAPLDCGGGVMMDLVLIPAGEFTMGSRANEADRNSHEGPQHRVRITKPSYMGKHEVTQAQYERIVGKNPSHFGGASNPVESVSWTDATEFCRKLSQRTGTTVRLPTEAEWEYACRAGTTTAFHYGNSLGTDQANFDGNYPYGGAAKGKYWQKTTPVGSFRPNAWGLYDMHGNVCEWCSDWFDEGYYAKSPGTDPQGPGTGKYRVLRGGSWIDDGHYCRSAFRSGYPATDRIRYYGFRVVVSARGR